MVIQATQEVSVSLDNKQQKAIASDYLRKSIDWKDNYFVNEEDGWVYENRECHTTHSFEITARVRKANREDLVLNDILKNHFFNL